jgi:hypothetical protein
MPADGQGHRRGGSAQRRVAAPLASGITKFRDERRLDFAYVGAEAGLTLVVGTEEAPAEARPQPRAVDHPPHRTGSHQSAGTAADPRRGRGTVVTSMTDSTSDATNSTDAYDEHSIQVLEGLDAVRKRPGMYIGGTGSDGLMHLVWEIIDNAVDEAAAGFANLIEVTLHKDRSVEVTDNGRGIPTGVKDGKRTALEYVFTELHAGGKFGSGAYSASGGLHGVGASVVNALSTKLIAEVDRDGTTQRLGFKDRKPGQFGPNGGFKAGSKLEVVQARSRAKRTGTRVRFWPDTDIFDPGRTHRRRQGPRPRRPGLLPRPRPQGALPRQARQPSRASPRSSSAKGGLSRLRRLPVDRRTGHRGRHDVRHGHVHREGARRRQA